MLDDLLAPDVKIVFCGTAAGKKSAAKREYYARPENKFWSILHEVGLTDRLLVPGEYRELLGFGIGLTDVVKGQSGGDSDIDFRESDPDAVKQKILNFSPAVLAFNGKKAAKVFLECKDIEYGAQDKPIGRTLLFVAPSTSGAANGYWNEEFWYQLAGLGEGLAP